MEAKRKPTSCTKQSQKQRVKQTSKKELNWNENKRNKNQKTHKEKTVDKRQSWLSKRNNSQSETLLSLELINKESEKRKCDTKCKRSLILDRVEKVLPQGGQRTQSLLPIFSMKKLQFELLTKYEKVIHILIGYRKWPQKGT